ncbi:ion channel DMI1 isoform X5 [Malania oleifera]|uniref:ion channel DMI1 isoform X5 n=1 Tax=Malania oleifera TaxID=397392 RepID=UPI0025AEB237|nr:ion channel DMI1 isoform X5 [Malania oleifera]
MPLSVEDSTLDTNPGNKSSERPSCFKRSRTIAAGELRRATPLFPALRRVSSSLSCSNRPFGAPARRASIKASIFDGRHGRLVDAVQGMSASAAESIPKVEKEVVPMAARVSGSGTTDGACIIWRFNCSWVLYLLTFCCILSVSYVIYLWIETAGLQEEIINLHKECSQKDVGNNIIRVLQREDINSLSYFSNADSRTVALYTVLFVLSIPFLLFKYLDYLPQIKNLLKREMNNKEEVSLKKRIAYRVDVFFSVYPYAKILGLLFATVFLIAFGGLALYAVSDGSFGDALWLSWTFVVDSGNHADRVGTGPRIISVSLSSGGMLIFAMMLGLVSDAISENVDSLRKGKSEVIERNHILILGWSDKLVSVSKARAIIVLASDENADQSDARALRVVLSLTGVKEGLRGHVVVEMSDLDNEPLVKLVGGELVETVVAHDVIGRLMIQCALQPGLAQIWEDILGFENAEFYIKRWPQLDGMRFEDVLISFPDAVPCGIKVAADGGKIIINPDDNYVLEEDDEVLVIAEDDDTYAPGPLPEVRRGFFPHIIDPPKYPEKILFCGWRRDIDDMIMVLEALLAPGSELWMFNDVPEKEREKKLTDGGLDVSQLENIKLVHREGNAVIRRHLESLPLETFDSILILADESVEDSIVHSDSRSLATLLLIRDIQSKRLPCKDPSRHSGFSHSSWIREMQQASDKSIIISEILDSRTRNLVSVSRISDYVLSNELVSMALAMVSEDKQINRVLEELFAEEGNEMCIKPAEFYVFDQEELCFFDIMIRGRQRQEIVIGYRLAATERAIINPAKKSEPRKWSLDDVFVVISLGD